MLKKELGATLAALTLSLGCITAQAGVDRDFKAYPDERFTIETGDGNYKQAYHWAFNEAGSGPEVVVFLNHGSGGEWYREIETSFGPCGPDYIDDSSGDFTGSAYAGACVTDDQGERIHLHDHQQHFVPVGEELDEFMLKRIVGSTAFAAWYWQDAFTALDSPVHIFMVGRYNIAKNENAFDNVLYWLDRTDPDSVNVDTQPPYNFDGYGVADIDHDQRPEHSAPELSAFDNMHLYRAVRERHPELDLNNIIIEGRSNGGSAAIMLAADSAIWTASMHEFWARNLPNPYYEVETLHEELQNYLGGEFYSDVKLVHSLYPGCSMGGLMQKKDYLDEDEIRDDGDSRDGYRVALPLLMAFGAQDSLYKQACDDRIDEGRANQTIDPFLFNNWGVDGTAAVEGQIFNPARHGFDHKDVHKNLPNYSTSDQAKAAQSRAAIEKAVNTAATELGLILDWSLPVDLD